MGLKPQLLLISDYKPQTLLQEHFLRWLRALHKALDEDNVLAHIIFCVDGVQGESVQWYLRQFNPCIEYSEKDNEWKTKLEKVLEGMWMLVQR